MNNAARFEGAPALSATKEALESVFAASLFSALYMIQETYPHMSNGGRIVNIGSIASKLAIPIMPLYATVKAALDTLTFSIAEELGRRGKNITVNVVSPGPVATEMMSEGGEQIDELAKWMVSATRLEGRVGNVEDIADAVLLVVSEKARWITGQHISASGGITGN